MSLRFIGDCQEPVLAWIKKLSRRGISDGGVELFWNVRFLRRIPTRSGVAWLLKVTIIGSSRFTRGVSVPIWVVPHSTLSSEEMEIGFEPNPLLVPSWFPGLFGGGPGWVSTK